MKRSTKSWIQTFRRSKQYGSLGENNISWMVGAVPFNGIGASLTIWTSTSSENSNSCWEYVINLLIKIMCHETTLTKQRNAKRTRCWTTNIRINATYQTSTTYIVWGLLSELSTGVDLNEVEVALSLLLIVEADRLEVLGDRLNSFIFDFRVPFLKIVTWASYIYIYLQWILYILGIGNSAEAVRLHFKCLKAQTNKRLEYCIDIITICI